MRSTCGRALWLFNDKQELVGLSMGSDATTEHELGTKELASSFGYDYGAKAGVMARKITQLPKGFGFATVTHEGESCLLLSSNVDRAKRYIDSELRFPRQSADFSGNTAAAWDSNDFAVLSRGADMPHLAQLAKAFEQFDVMAGGMLTSKYHRAGGLVYAVASMVPQEILDATQQKLDEEIVREDILNASGIHDTLRKAGRSWYSLRSTMWEDDTKTSIRVWLNPQEQREHNAGWFTLAELELWAKGEGPVMMAKRRA